MSRMRQWDGDNKRRRHNDSGNECEIRHVNVSNADSHEATERTKCPQSEGTDPVQHCNIRLRLRINPSSLVVKQLNSKFHHFQNQLLSPPRGQ